jgi:hypothetical protein
VAQNLSQSFSLLQKISQPVAGQPLVLNSGVVDHGQGATQLIVEEPEGVVLHREHVKGTVPQDLVRVKFSINAQTLAQQIFIKN